ncbi:hypothetical protein [Rhizobium sp. RU36D]|uniref:hypothetical protein n=1 Tax=Rhizobium sp. RU36D TaxID=1907415 RepID=UPI0009D8062F|nr:hypothetical protein [Rhizobium sp. RU36D]SMC72806.1 hypothetical protein SAMN05880593_105179 [Rhizobium sp. RU36D]
MTGGQNAPSEISSSQERHETLYLLRETLAALVEDKRIKSFSLGCREGMGLLDIRFRPGLVPGLNLRRGEILFAPEHLGVCWEQVDGLRRGISIKGEDPDQIAGLLLDPMALLLPVTGNDVPWQLREAKPSEGFKISCAAIRMLLRHASVTDLLFGSDGSECSLQFQLADGFAGICSQSPEDWVGLDFDDTTADLSWFDRTGNYSIRSYRWPDDADVLARLEVDPLGHVMLAGLDASVTAASQGILGLMQTLTSSFQHNPSQ